MVAVDCARYQRYHRPDDDNREEHRGRRTRSRRAEDRPSRRPSTTENVDYFFQRRIEQLPPGFTPPFPPPGPGERVLFLRTDETDGAPGREHEDIMLRRVPRDTAMQFRAAAGGRSLTHGQYLTALVDLHRRIRERADAGDAELQAVLGELGLATVTV